MWKLLKKQKKERNWKFWFTVIVGVNVIFWGITLVTYFILK